LYFIPTSFLSLIGTAAAQVYTLSLHDALPICRRSRPLLGRLRRSSGRRAAVHQFGPGGRAFTHRRQRFPRHSRAVTRPVPLHWRSEEHTSELQSRENLVCRLLLEKKNKNSRSH